MKRVLSILFIGLALLTMLGYSSCSCGGTDESGSALSEFEDSLAMESLKNNVADMVEEIFTNQQGRIKVTDVIPVDSNGESVPLRAFDADSVVYMYFTPLACWECIKSASAAIQRGEHASRIRYLIPESLRNAVNQIMAEAEIPDSQVCYVADGCLGLPIEDDNKIFFFTLDRDSSDNRYMVIRNVFSPIREVENLTDIYLGVLIE